MGGRIEAGSNGMLSLVVAVLRSLAARIHALRILVLENLALRHPLLVLNRTVKAPTLRNSNWLFWAALSAMWSHIKIVLGVVRHEATLLTALPDA